MADRDSDHVNTVGEPDEGKPHVRFDEGRLGRFRLNQSPTLPFQAAITDDRNRARCRQSSITI
jgi:hypothetical protein